MSLPYTFDSRDLAGKITLDTIAKAAQDYLQFEG